jgi:hypothetical protein
VLFAVGGTAEAKPRDCTSGVFNGQPMCAKHFVARQNPQTFTYGGEFPYGTYASSFYAREREFLPGVACKAFARLGPVRVRQNTCRLRPTVTYHSTAGPVPFVYRFQMAR